MSLNVQPVSTLNSDGTSVVPAISQTGQVQVASDDLRRLNEISLLLQQAQLLSVQLANDKTAHYTFQEIR